MALNYTSVERAGKVAGAFVQVVDEAVGTGDGTTTIFRLQHMFILNESQSVYIDGGVQTITTDYTFDDDLGQITFVIAPAAGEEITAKYKNLPDKVSSDIAQHLDGAEAEVNNLFRTIFSRTNSEDIYVDGDGDGTVFLYQDKIPLLAINSIEILDSLGNVSRTLTTADYGFNSRGRIFLRQRIDTVLVYGFGTTVPKITGTFPPGFQNIKINFDYGYDSVPEDINELTAILTAMRFLTEQMGGTFDDVTSFTMGSKTVSVGEPYTNIRATMVELRKRADRIISNRRMVDIS